MQVKDQQLAQLSHDLQQYQQAQQELQSRINEQEQRIQKRKEKGKIGERKRGATMNSWTGFKQFKSETFDFVHRTHLLGESKPTELRMALSPSSLQKTFGFAHFDDVRIGGVQ